MRSALHAGWMRARRLQWPGRGRAHARASGAGPSWSCSSRRPATSTAENASAHAADPCSTAASRDAVVVCAPAHLLRARWIFRRVYGAHGIRVTRARRPRACPLPAAIVYELGAATVATTGTGRVRHRMSDTLVFIPAWNEEDNLPAVLDALHAELPTPTCSSSTTARPTAPPTSRASTAHRCTRWARTSAFGSASRPATDYALEHGYAYCGRVDADGQHPPRELARLLALVRSGDVRRRRRVAVRLGRRLPRVPLPSEPGATPRHGRPAAGDGARARPPVRRRDERPLRGQREGAAAARGDLHEPRAGGGSTRPDRERGPHARGSARARWRRARAANRSCAARRP